MVWFESAKNAGYHRYRAPMKILLGQTDQGNNQNVPDCNCKCSSINTTVISHCTLPMCPPFTATLPLHYFLWQQCAKWLLVPVHLPISFKLMWIDEIHRAIMRNCIWISWPLHSVLSESDCRGRPTADKSPGPLVCKRDEAYQVEHVSWKKLTSSSCDSDFMNTVNFNCNFKLQYQYILRSFYHLHFS